MGTKNKEQAKTKKVKSALRKAFAKSTLPSIEGIEYKFDGVDLWVHDTKYDVDEYKTEHYEPNHRIFFDDSYSNWSSWHHHQYRSEVLADDETININDLESFYNYVNAFDTSKIMQRKKEKRLESENDHPTLGTLGAGECQACISVRNAKKVTEVLDEAFISMFTIGGNITSEKQIKDDCYLIRFNDQLCVLSVSLDQIHDPSLKKSYQKAKSQGDALNHYAFSNEYKLYGRRINNNNHQIGIAAIGSLTIPRFYFGTIYSLEKLDKKQQARVTGHMM